jgi:hypothetical protein
MECAHWRAAYEGSHLAQVFLHYVDQHGPHAEWKFDKRPSLTGLPGQKDFTTEAQRSRRTDIDKNNTLTS